MEKIVEQTLLFDFYGELLTEHQKIIYEDVVFGDLSFTEAAEARSISRQGVHDMIKRCNKILAEYEDKLHLVEKFQVIKGKVEDIRMSADDPERIKQISDEILEEL
ncbi:MAG: DNA-binding protein [Lachnospiraceae bacterium]|jgi:hypothetical protein|uniref:DNA-binding protein n=1 Tax=Hominisplanchenecus murintestinalis TaxID=2941517 RepID=A0AC61R2U9_9FIRM|nr:DNA-binding protein [Hominisplanchenecus murintestinalis]MCI9516102.1 DNA-binding protein [Lachnospiraceae bacterium]RKJ97821.1 DNA-binding protein [Anaerotruncus sp. 1XD22-93]MCI9660393.1 DNA-binding protein [Lachnospiraceae bacterium]NBH97335.1 DNA-binding protein [Lachnospiraceae bacterium]NBI74392.1 DNA-binding protein [Lachnospiraceae bacterium]